jgi:nitrate reductase NapE component
MYIAVITALVFGYGLIIWISGQTELVPDVRKNLPPEAIESIYEELQYRCLVGLLMMVISMFPVMTYLCFYL